MIPAIKPLLADERAAQRFLDTVQRPRIERYEAYFNQLRPQDDATWFRRALFAFASVHTTWELNCRLYTALYDLEWLGNERLLLNRIVESGAGLHNNRTKFIMKFAQDFWACPQWYRKQAHEDWVGYRDRVCRSVAGLGPAKTAFMAELTYFHDCQVPCMDTHLIQLYTQPGSKQTQGASDAFIRWCEDNWCKECQNRGLAPVTCRWYFWDEKQRQPDSRYWSSVLEGSPDKFYKQTQMYLFPEAERVTWLR